MRKTIADLLRKLADKIHPNEGGPKPKPPPVPE